MKAITISTGEFSNNSNLPKGRQIFINDENHNDIACFFNWEKDEDKFNEKEKELKKLAVLFSLAPKMEKSIREVLNIIDNNKLQHNVKYFKKLLKDLLF